MKVSLLNTTVTIEVMTETIDAVGNRLAEWETYYVCHATISGESGNVISKAGLRLDDADMTVTLRWCSKTAVIVPNRYHLLLNGEIYSITSVDHMNYKRKSLKLKCRKEDHYGQTHQGQSRQG